jgi:uncharacterized protein (TIGR00251 family)
MKISVRVKTNSRRNEVLQINGKNFLVSVSVPPIEGKANKRIIELLAEFFNKPKRNITIARGENSKNKVIEII